MFTHHQQSQQQTTARKGISAKWIGALVLLAIAITFIVQNRQTVNITLFITTVSTPLWAALACVLVFGAACGFLLALRRR